MLITGAVGKKHEDQKHRKQTLNRCNEAMTQSEGSVGLEAMKNQSQPKQNLWGREILKRIGGKDGRWQPADNQREKQTQGN